MFSFILLAVSHLSVCDITEILFSLPTTPVNTTFLTIIALFGGVSGIYCLPAEVLPSQLAVACQLV